MITCEQKPTGGGTVFAPLTAWHEQPNLSEFVVCAPPTPNFNIDVLVFLVRFEDGGP